MTYTQENAKTVLFWLLSALMVMLIITMFSVIGFFGKANATANTVVFSGEGKVSALPDIATVEFSIVTDGATSTDAQNKNSVKSKAVADFLKKQGVEDKDINPNGYNIYPQYYYPQAGNVDKSPSITSYQVTQGFRVKIRNLDKASAIVDGLVKAGVNQVNNLQFEIENPEKLKAEARSKAIADAKQRADELKGQIGIKLGRIVNFSENIGGYPIYNYDKTTMLEGRGGGFVGPTLPTGENEIIVSVSITYQIK